MKIISIDPGYERLGIAVIEKELKGKEVLLFSECFKTSAKLPHHERLTLIGNRIKEVIKKWKPQALATEKLFFSANQKTALFVAEARGVILYAGSSESLPVFEYRPNEIKIAITGYGRSEKKQMMDMTRKLIKIDSKTKSDDEFDAIAIGLTHFAISR
ncbi:MAG: crossover junction endodeoxyribonuclease RuvC [Patescibacteria group bacterium]